MMVHDIYLRGCSRCRLVFWFFPVDTKTDCKQCGHETARIAEADTKSEPFRFQMEVD